MTESSIVLTEHDHKRLCHLLDQALFASNLSLRGDLKRLNLEVQSAQIVRPEMIPADVVTMNSRVRVTDLSDGEVSEWTVTFPEKADVAANRISVMSPLGTALLGARRGEIVEWATPSGKGQMRIDDILFQPEASGNFEL